MSSDVKEQLTRDPLNHLMGRKAADVRQAIDFEDDLQTFSIVPTQLPKSILWGAVILYLFAVPVAVVILGYVKNKPVGTSQVLMPYIFGLAMIGFLFWLPGSLKKNAMKVGPMLVVEKQSGKVILPRQNKLFHHSEILHLQVITGFDELSEVRQEVTEINLITVHEGKRMRWPISGGIHNYYKRKFVIDRLLEETDLPVMYYKQKWKKGSLTSVKTRNLREV